MKRLFLFVFIALFLFSADASGRIIALRGVDVALSGIWYDVRNQRTAGDGVTDDRDKINAAAAEALSAGVSLYIPEGDYRVASSLTFSCDVRFETGAKLNRDAGVIVTFDGKLEAELNQIFTGSGSSVLSVGSCPRVLPHWWGAVGDGVVDCHDAIESAIVAAGTVGEVFLPSGIYKTTDTIDNFPVALPGAQTNGLLIRGSSMNDTVINYTGAGYAIKLWNSSQLTANDSLAVSYVTIRDLQIDAPSGSGISFNGCESCLLDRVSINDIDTTSGVAIHSCRGSVVITEDGYTHDTWKDFATAGKYATSFTTQSVVKGPLKDVTVTMKKIDGGSLAGTITAALYTDSAGPNTLVGYASNTVNCTALSTSAAEVVFSWDWDKVIMTTANAKQWIVFETSGYTYNDGVDEIAIYVDAGAGAANEFGTYSGSWSLSTDGANNIVEILKRNAQFNRLHAVHVRKLAATAGRYGLYMEDDSQFYLTQCSIFAKQPVYAKGEPYIQAGFSTFENDDEDRPIYVEVTPVDNAGGTTCWTNCWFEEGTTNPLYFDGGLQHVFVGCNFGAYIEWSDGTPVLMYGSSGQLYGSDGGGQVMQDMMRRTYVPGSQFLKVSGGTTADADALNGVRIDLAYDETVTLAFGVGKNRQGVRLPRGIWAVTVYAGIDVAATDAMWMYIYSTGVVIKSHLLKYALTTTYEPYTGVIFVDSDVINNDKDIFINFKNKASGKTVYISHVVLEYLGADDTRRDVILTNPAAEDTDGGRESKVIWIGRRSGDEQDYLVTLTGSHDGAADDGKGQVVLAVGDGDDGEAPSVEYTWTSTGFSIAGAGRPTRQIELLFRPMVHPDGGSNDCVVTPEWDNTNRYSYYRTESTVAAQDIDIVWEFCIPDNYSAFTGSNSVSVFVRSSDYANATMQLSLIDSAGNIDSTITSLDIKPSANNTWQTEQTEPGSSYTVNERVRLHLHIANADADDTADVGMITIQYLASN